MTINPDDDLAYCAVCDNGDSLETDAIVICELCNVATHQSCYGIEVVPPGEEPWLCNRCRAGVSQDSLPCVLCGQTGGAMKPTDEAGVWAHLICAFLEPEAYIRDPAAMEPIVRRRQAPASRRKLVCTVCTRPNGTCIQCDWERCATGVHTTCARRSGALRLEVECGLMFKEAYCPAHIACESASSSTLVAPLSAACAAVPAALAAAGMPAGPLARATAAAKAAVVALREVEARRNAGAFEKPQFFARDVRAAVDGVIGVDVAREDFERGYRRFLRRIHRSAVTSDGRSNGSGGGDDGSEGESCRGYSQHDGRWDGRGIGGDNRKSRKSDTASAPAAAASDASVDWGEGSSVEGSSRKPAVAANRGKKRERTVRRNSPAAGERRNASQPRSTERRKLAPPPSLASPQRPPPVPPSPPEMLAMPALPPMPSLSGQKESGALFGDESLTTAMPQWPGSHDAGDGGFGSSSFGGMGESADIGLCDGGLGNGAGGALGSLHLEPEWSAGGNADSNRDLGFQLEAAKPATASATASMLESPRAGAKFGRFAVARPTPIAAAAAAAAAVAPPAAGSAARRSAAGGGRPPADGDEHNLDEENCAVCDDGTCSAEDAIVACDGCDVAVHQSCYGVRSIPPGDEPWYCSRCRDGVTPLVVCCLCGASGGALKPCMGSGGSWAHVLCVWLTPHAYVVNQVTMEPVAFRAAKKSMVNAASVARGRSGCSGGAGASGKAKSRGGGGSGSYGGENGGGPCCVCGVARGLRLACRWEGCADAVHPVCARTVGFLRVRTMLGSLMKEAFCHRHSDRRGCPSAVLAAIRLGVGLGAAARPAPPALRAANAASVAVTVPGVGGSGGLHQVERRLLSVEKALDSGVYTSLGAFEAAIDSLLAMVGVRADCGGRGGDGAIGEGWAGSLVSGGFSSHAPSGSASAGSTGHDSDSDDSFTVGRGSGGGGRGSTGGHGGGAGGGGPGVGAAAWGGSKPPQAADGDWVTEVRTLLRVIRNTIEPGADVWK